MLSFYWVFFPMRTRSNSKRGKNNFQGRNKIWLALQYTFLSLLNCLSRLPNCLKTVSWVFSHSLLALLACSRRSDSAARAKKKVSERAGKKRGETSPVSPRIFPALSLALVFAPASLSVRLEQATLSSRPGHSCCCSIFLVCVFFVFFCFVLFLPTALGVATFISRDRLITYFAKSCFPTKGRCFELFKYFYVHFASSRLSYAGRSRP